LINIIDKHKILKLIHKINLNINFHNRLTWLMVQGYNAAQCPNKNKWRSSLNG